MSTYAIGDVQGCFKSLMNLLEKINFSSADTLWFAGDLVNRGPRSLEVLRFCRSLSSKHQFVLGNHDLHLLALAYVNNGNNRKDTLGEIFAAADKTDLIDWLRQQPLFIFDPNLDYVMSHAGIAPQWDLVTAQNLADEISQNLRANPLHFLRHMYGNEPNLWNPTLQGTDRLRCITNYFTRMRFCYANGSLNLTYKGSVKDHPQELIPWFNYPQRKIQQKIIFGHWAALDGETNLPDVFALDTGCIWGNTLTALRLEDQQRISVPFAD